MRKILFASVARKENSLSFPSGGQQKKNTYLLLIVTFFLFFSLTACKNKEKAVDPELEIKGVPETGTIIDISDKNSQSVTATPGDVLYLKLTGEADSGKQWSVSEPTSGNFLMLKDHKLVGMNDPNILEGQFSDEWWLKIEEKGTFKLKYIYGVVNQEVEKTFELEINSQ